MFKDIKKGQICDSIVQSQELQIINFKDVLSKDNQIITENNKRLSQLTSDINKANLKLKVSSKLSIYGIPISLGVGIIVGILVIK